MLDIEAYLNRINFSDRVNCDLETLRQLHLAHLLNVPFENLSIHTGQAIVLDDEALFEKIVTRRRGGFCYELNGLFAALLREIGFEAAMLSAQVANPAGEFSRDFDHMTLMVAVDEQRWLADVGFGDCFIEPIPFDHGVYQQRDSSYRITRTDEDRFILERSQNAGGWQPQYRFSLQPYAYHDYAEMCRYHQTSPDSHFTRQRICSRLTPLGRVSLSDRSLIVTENGVRSERPVNSEEEYSEILRDEFGIVM
jgi:N-hydroxyarylamine O-acetyltransferase